MKMKKIIKMPQNNLQSKNKYFILKFYKENNRNQMKK